MTLSNQKMIDDFNAAFLNPFEEIVKRSNRTAPTFPFYNILKLGENDFALEIALAGYLQEELSVKLDDGLLIVEGIVGDTDLTKQAEEEIEFLYKGISCRNFKVSFALGENLAVTGASFDNGLLGIGLKRFSPKPKEVVSIDII